MRARVVRLLLIAFGLVIPGAHADAQAAAGDSAAMSKSSQVMAREPRSSPLAASDERERGWLPSLVLGAGAGLEPRGSMPSDGALLAGLELAHAGMFDRRLRLRIDYLASYRGDGIASHSLSCDGCSSFTQGASLSLVLVPLPDARLQPYALAGVGGFHHRNRFTSGLETTRVESGLVFGAGLTARLSRRADAFVELRTVGVGGGLVPLTGGLRWRF